MGTKVKEAADKNEPYIISRQLIEICKQFNRFYNTNNIMQSEDKQKQARLALVDASAASIRFGLGLLGINAPESM